MVYGRRTNKLNKICLIKNNFEIFFIFNLRQALFPQKVKNLLKNLEFKGAQVNFVLFFNWVALQIAPEIGLNFILQLQMDVETPGFGNVF